MYVFTDSFLENPKQRKKCSTSSNKCFLFSFQYFTFTDVGYEAWLVGPNVRGPEPSADRGLPTGGGWSGSRGGGDRAQHAAAETQEQHFVCLSQIQSISYAV